jgi:AraC family transcriptional regulator
MRTSQRQRYAEQIDRVLRYLEALDWSVENAPDLEVLASIAHVSPWHFHRVFRLMTGESVGAVVRRVRVARGLAALSCSAQQVTEAAMTSGYGTSQAGRAASTCVC